MHPSIRTRLLISLFLVATLTAGALSWFFLGELEAYGLRKLEERLGSEAVLAVRLTETLGVDDTTGLNDALEDMQTPGGSSVRIVDASGTVIADSWGQSIGTDLSARPEIAAALAGEYGAHTRTTSDGRLGLFVAYPVLDEDGDTVGAASSAASTFSIMTLIRDYRLRLAGVLAVFAAFTLLVAELLSRWLAAPLTRLAQAATTFAAGDHDVRVRPSGSRETRAVGEAFNQMADEVDRVVVELREEERRKTRFVSDVSHELRSPLTGIRGMAETLAEGDVPPEDARRFLATIVREADRLARLADDLLTLQRIEGATGELPIRRVEPLEVARRAAAGMEHLAEMRGVTVRVEGAAPAVLGDPDRLQQVVANLLDNASRVMSDGGMVTVRLEQDADWAKISVLDEGPGIPEEDLPRIFDRFYRAEPSRDRSSGGAGLGLAIVRAIVERHAGRIEVTNRPEGGVCVTVLLPGLRG